MDSQSSNGNSPNQSGSNKTKGSVVTKGVNDEKAALKRRVGELEAKIAQLEAGQPQGVNLVGPTKAKLPRVFIFLLILTVAAIPALLVVKDRWLDSPFEQNLIEQWWHQSGLANITALPSYFLITFLCILATLILVKLLRGGPLVFFSEITQRDADALDAASESQRRLGKILVAFAAVLIICILAWALLGKHVPGWDLLFALLLYVVSWIIYDIPCTSIKKYWGENGMSILAMTFSSLALIAFFASLFSKEGLLWIFAALLILAVYFLFQFRHHIPIVYWIINIALISFTMYINSWWFSVIGDEYSFYNYAVELATRQPLSVIGDRLFNGQGVYGTHPQISTLIQAIFMKVLGTHNFGWRFSNVFLSAVAIGFFYLFLKVFVPHRIALITALFLAASEYLMTFGKIGYNNLQSFFTLGLILWAASLAIQTRRLSSYAFLGLAIGFCFYVYPAALYTIILPLILLVIYDPPTSKDAVLRWGILSASSLAIIFPLFFQPQYWSIKRAGTFLYNPEITQSVETLFGHLGKNLLYALLSFLYILEESHFIAVSYVDPVSAALLIIGFAYAIRNITKTRFSLFWMIGFLLMVLLVGVSHDRTFPPSTRMFLLLPWFAFFAATGLIWIHFQATQLSWLKISGMIIPVVIFAVFATNFYQAYTLSPIRMERYQGIEALFLRTTQKGAELNPGTPKRYIFITQPNWGIDGLLMIQNVYQTPDSPLQISRVMLTNDDLARGLASGNASDIIPETDVPWLQDKNAIVFLQRYTSADWSGSVEAALAEYGMTSCNARNASGRIVMKIWHYDMYNQICD